VYLGHFLDLLGNDGTSASKVSIFAMLLAKISEYIS
jgi:hypothetical protein